MKTGIKIAGKLTLLVTAAALMWIVLTPFFRKDPGSSAYQLSLLPEDSVDVLVLGSSHAQYSINPGVIYDHSGIYSFVMGSGCQPMIMSYYFLEEALKTQHPDVVLLDVFTMLPSQAICYADGMFYVAASQMSGQTRIDAMHEIDNAEKIQEYLIDLPITHDRWKEEGFYKRSIDGMFGFVPMQPTDFTDRYVAEIQPSAENVSLRSKDVDALNRIIYLCDNQGIELILMKSIFDRTEKDVSALNEVKKIADEHDVVFLDFHDLADEIGFMFGKDGDSWHNTTWGAEKVSRYLSDYLVDHQLVSHQMNDQMEKVYQGLAETSVRWLFEENVDIYSVMAYAAEYDVTVLVRYQGNAQPSYITEYENQALRSIGIDFDFLENGDQNLYAVIQHGKTVKQSNEGFEIEMDGTNVSIQDLEIIVGNQSFTQLGELELIFCGNDFSWFYEMPMDVHTKAFWKNGCAGWMCFGQ